MEDGGARPARRRDAARRGRPGRRPGPAARPAADRRGAHLLRPHRAHRPRLVPGPARPGGRPGRATAAGEPGRALDHRRARQPDPGIPGYPGPALRRGSRPAADGVPHRVAADPGRRPHPRPAGDRRLRRPRRRLQLAVRAQRRVQAGPRRQPARAPRRSAARHRRGDRMIFGAGQGQGESETGRLEAFSDGVIAIMALELKPPEEPTFRSLHDRLPALLFYVLSFTFVGIYWNYHHHLLRAARRVTPGVMWANLHLLFWLSLIPVLTEWVGEHHTETAPAATYGVMGLGAAVAFTILVRAIIR